MKTKKSFEDFVSSLKETNRDWKYWSNYEKIINLFDKFKILLLGLGKCDEKEFKTKFKFLVEKNKEFLECTPLFSGIRYTNFSLIDDGIEKNFNWKNTSFDEAIYFLKKIGFFAIFNKIDFIDFPSYYIGLEVGLDSNSRKNRGGKLMERVVFEKLSKMGLKVTTQIKFSNLSKVYQIEIKKNSIKNKVFDLSFVHKNVLYLVETNFFNSGGSKINETLRSFIKLQNEIKNYISSMPIKFIYITDGCKLKTDINGLEDAYNAIEIIYNIDDLEEGIL